MMLAKQALESLGMMHYNHAKTQGHHNPKPFILRTCKPCKKLHCRDSHGHGDGGHSDGAACGGGHCDLGLWFRVVLLWV